MTPTYITSQSLTSSLVYAWLIDLLPIYTLTFHITLTHKHRCALLATYVLASSSANTSAAHEGSWQRNRDDTLWRIVNDNKFPVRLLDRLPFLHNKAKMKEAAYFCGSHIWHFRCLVVIFANKLRIQVVPEFLEQ